MSQRRHETVDSHPPEVLAGAGMVTAISGLTFVISNELGDVEPGPCGLIVRDTRHLSRLDLRVDGEPLHHLGAGLPRPAVAHFRGYAMPPGRYPDPPVESERTRWVHDAGMDEELVLRSWAMDEIVLELTLGVAADFADIFAVRRMAGGLDAHLAPVAAAPSAEGVHLVSADGSRATTVRVTPPADRVDADGFHWRVSLAHDVPWRLQITAAAEISGGVPEWSHPRRDGLAHSPTRVSSEPERLARACGRSLEDLSRLSMHDSLDPERLLLAAGIPWFVALFGRDALISSHQARAFHPRLMLDTLSALAARQGRVDDPGNGEQPGKILHEVRLGELPWLGEGTTRGARPYYGSVDSTPLFLLVLGEARRWGAGRDELRALLPAARAAYEWMRGPGDPDGDGFIEYRAGPGRSLFNQGWKDSENAIQHPDGRLAEGSIAVVEVQGYAYRARRELAQVLAWLGEEREAARLEEEAAALRTLIRERFWHEGREGEPGFFALALDGDKRQVASVASNMGHLLWCGVPSNAEAEAVSAWLTGEGMASGWGLRTLSAAMAGFNPISYHCGSVWPHDTAIACEGLRRYGLDEMAMTLAGALLDALAVFEDRLPELFGGHRRVAGDFPAPYPTACRPQAWAAGVPLSFVPLLLGLEPDIPSGIVALNPVLPAGFHTLDVRGLPLAGGRLSVALEDEGVRLIEAPPNLRVELSRPSTEAALSGATAPAGAPRGPRAA